MRADPGLARVVRSWLREDGHEDAEHVLFAVLSQIDTTPQRRASWLGRMLSAMNSPTSILAVAAAVLVLVVAGYALLPGTNIGSGSTPSPTMSPGPVPSAAVLPLSDGTIPPGRYTLRNGGFPIQASFDVPAGWSSSIANAMEQGVCSLRVAGGVCLTFYNVVNVVTNPCEETLLDTPPGPTVDDFIAAVSALEGFTATAPVDVTVSGYAGEQFELTAPMFPDCPALRTWATSMRTNGVGRGEANLLTVLDVNGMRVVIARSHLPGTTSDAALAELDVIFDSLQISEIER